MPKCLTCGAKEVSTPCPPWKLIRNQQCERCATWMAGKFQSRASLRYCQDCWTAIIADIDRNLGLNPDWVTGPGYDQLSFRP